MAVKDEALCTMCVSSPAYYIANWTKCEQACANTPIGRAIRNPVIDCALCSSSVAYQQLYVKQCGDKCGQAAKDAINSSNPIAGLFQANIWLRVAEVGLGIVLIIVGVVKLAPPSVKSAAKVAALL